ncbi:hypothetical protein MIMGU_mgv1a012748mg [Erythranthe guttata]|uniref:Sialate O-acetylesterase domain-containing protein n=1 Tax=Erythranthe guttata TaxID=4155 RepID=A0A022RUS4_ERYGU|nr:hypothetical protein MIMGU_mgv1a012748mg [Erythranthe guttata]
MDSQNKQIFILAGQSNMSGRGGVDKNKIWDGVVPAESSADAAKIFRLGPDHRSWEAAAEPLHQGLDSNRVCGVSPGMAFANAVKERVGAVGLVPCAVAGTAIKDWARGMEPYENLVRRAKAAAASGGGEIKALLWYQGEKDTFTAEDAAVYKEKTEQLILNVRQDLDLPSLPVVLVALPSGRAYLEKVREIQKRGIELPNVVCVDAMGLPLEEDNLHITTEAHVKLGIMLANSYLTHFVPK